MSIEVSCSESYKNVQQEHNVDDVVKNFNWLRVKEIWFESDLERNLEAVIDCQQNDKQVPVSFCHCVCFNHQPAFFLLSKLLAFFRYEAKTSILRFENFQDTFNPFISSEKV